MRRRTTRADLARDGGTLASATTSELEAEFAPPRRSWAVTDAELADRVERTLRRGWARGASYRDEQGRVCVRELAVAWSLWGALAEHASPDKARAVLARLDASLSRREKHGADARKRTRARHPSVVLWHDDPARTLDDVLAALRRVLR